MFRFSIRELLLVMLVVALGVGWFAEHRRAQAASKAAIEKEVKSEAMETKLKIEGYEVLQDGLRVEIHNKTDPEKWFFIQAPRQESGP